MPKAEHFSGPNPQGFALFVPSCWIHGWDPDPGDSKIERENERDSFLNFCDSNTNSDVNQDSRHFKIPFLAL
jgi:hypothetical protein